MSEFDTFDPNSLAGSDSNIYGLPFTPANARMVIIPVPWEVTVSYNAGTAGGPRAILAASRQVDLFDPELPDAWRYGLAMDEIDASLEKKNKKFRKRASRYIEFLEEGGDIESGKEGAEMRDTLSEINEACERMNEFVEKRASEILASGKIACLVGGDHSTPLGLMRALGKQHEEWGILHFDAHADLRDAYEGFEYSHASIMFNALSIPTMRRLVQVGIRDYCEAEHDLVRDSGGRIVTHYDRDTKARLYSGESFRAICDDVVTQLPCSVYVSFDIDGLDPKLCPNTGTPVPGGLELEQALYLVKAVVDSGRTIIGFDVNEVAPGEDGDEWDANVGARLLYRLANLTFKSQKAALAPSAKTLQ